VLTKKGQKAVSGLQSETTELAELLSGDVRESDLRGFRRMLADVGARLTELSKEMKP
jgi:hypothetical protein